MANPNGRPKGSPNKVTQDARAAIATFVDGNAHRLTEWLDKVADGVKAVDPDTGVEMYVVSPNPAKAFDMFQSVVEYHIPKLARQEINGSIDTTVKVDTGIFDEILKTMLLKRQTEK